MQSSAREKEACVRRLELEGVMVDISGGKSPTPARFNTAHDSRGCAYGTPQYFSFTRYQSLSTEVTALSSTLSISTVAVVQSLNGGMWKGARGCQWVPVLKGKTVENAGKAQRISDVEAEKALPGVSPADLGALLAMHLAAPAIDIVARIHAAPLAPKPAPWRIVDRYHVRFRPAQIALRVQLEKLGYTPLSELCVGAWRKGGWGRFSRSTLFCGRYGDYEVVDKDGQVAGGGTIRVEWDKDKREEAYKEQGDRAVLVAEPLKRASSPFAILRQLFGLPSRFLDRERSKNDQWLNSVVFGMLGRRLEQHLRGSLDTLHTSISRTQYPTFTRPKPTAFPHMARSQLLLSWI
ncbi:hypothetical protein PENSPDRAFT_760123 [Peniophora sp. CONT]|nr:hypothetical protein PENSPDRAFT_760123 [Peniophora sp. CONT]